MAESREVRRVVSGKPLAEWVFAAASVAMLVFLVGPLLALLATEPAQIARAAASDTELRAAVAVSLGCALAAVVLGLLLGTPLGYLLERDPQVRVGMFSSWYDSTLATLTT